jgi:predicted adenine nucleotide alpha hydrolase (AANH) superfamily ATPase
MTNKKELLYSRITRHGQNLKAMFNLDRDIDPVKLCKRLLRLETKAHRLAVEVFATGLLISLNGIKNTDQILTKVETILNNKKVLFLNGECSWLCSKNR